MSYLEIGRDLTVIALALSALGLFWFASQGPPPPPNGEVGSELWFAMALDIEINPQDDDDEGEDEE